MSVHLTCHLTPGFRILVIDDDEFLSLEIKIRLEGLGYSVATAASGQRGLELAELFQPQLVLVDWLMDGMDGLDVCRGLRKSRFGRQLYIMLLTGYDTESLLLQAFDAGVDDYVPKPIAPRVLLARIRAGERLILLQEQVEKGHREAHRYLHIVDVMIFGVNEQGDIALINRKSCDILGCCEEDVIGLNWLDYVIFEEYREPVRAILDYTASRGTENSGYFEALLQAQHGEQKLIAWRYSVIYENGALSGFLFAGEDLTEKRAAEREHQQLEKYLQQAQKMQAVGNLTGGIAHNFNNILASVIGYTELAQELVRDTESRSLTLFLNNIHEAGIEAKGLVETLMSFSRRGVADAQVPLLVPVLNDISRMLSPVLTSTVKLSVEVKGQVPVVLINPEQVHQMVTNLCINARDAMGDSGRIVISLRHHSHLKGVCSSCHHAFSGEYVELRVADNGGGVSDEVLVSMFDPFFSTKAVGKGTGLGLSMVHGSMHGSQGHILVDSTCGRGTDFRLLFPCVPLPEWSAPV
jgi:PAS domain S-box-containing protein